MINVIETLPGAAAAPDEAGEAAGAAGLPSTSSTADGGDHVLPGPAAAVAPAYLPYTLAGRNSAANPYAAASATEKEAALATRFGPQFALIQAALPSALQGQFVAQLTAAYGVPPGGDPAVQEGNTALSEPDLAKLIRGAVTGKDDAVLSSLVSHLAQDVARYGSAPVAQALHLTHDRIAFAAAAGTPSGTHPQTRVSRRDEEREQQRRQQRQDRDRREEAAAPPARDDAPGYTINDIVCYAGETVALNRTASPLATDNR